MDADRQAILDEVAALKQALATERAKALEVAAERAVAKTTTVRGFTRKRAERQTFPEHLPRERVVINRRPIVSAAAAIVCASLVKT